MKTPRTNPAPVFGRTAGGLLAASLEDHSWIAVPVRTGLRIANAWRLKKTMADWTEEDFWGSCGIVADEAAFRDHVAEIAEHHRGRLPVRPFAADGHAALAVDAAADLENGGLDATAARDAHLPDAARVARHLKA